MAFLLVSFVAGALTVLAPCILPLLPVVIGASASTRSKLTPFIVVGSLGLSIIVFTFLLKASTAFIMIPPQVWTYLSGGILVLFGLTLVFPVLWEALPGIAKLSAASNKAVGAGYQKKNLWGDVIIGAALGPVFSTCSPTYFVILASVLPASFALGTLYLLGYVAGLSLVLLLIAFLGQRFADRLTRVADSRGWIKRGLGILFIVLGLLIATGLEKKLETAILESGFFDVTKVEQQLLELIPDENSENQSGAMPYIDIVDPSGFVNADPFTLADLVGEQVILLDFMTYSCINCQRTFPYLNSWHEKYADEGLTIVGIHTPEFAFEKDIDNVRSALAEFGISFPVVLDNEYGTWRAYGNRYWPRKYLIDIHGNIVYDHIGEGKYEETEQKIRALLAERAMVLGEPVGSDTQLAPRTLKAPATAAGSPETYFGASRNSLLANGTPGRSGRQTFTYPQTALSNELYLSGTWDIESEFARSVEESAVRFVFRAQRVYLVASAPSPVRIEVFEDGVLQKTISVLESTLYTLIEHERQETHELELRIQGEGAELYTFTFG